MPPGRPCPGEPPAARSSRGRPGPARARRPAPAERETGLSPRARAFEPVSSSWLAPHRNLVAALLVENGLLCQATSLLARRVECEGRDQRPPHSTLSLRYPGRANE